MNIIIDYNRFPRNSQDNQKRSDLSFDGQKLFLVEDIGEINIYLFRIYNACLKCVFSIEQNLLSSMNVYI